MHMLLDRVAEEGQHAPEAAAESEKAIALKVRKFFIPLLSLVESYEGTMPEVTLAIRKLLENEQVNFILKTNMCEKDEVPIGIDEKKIPGLVDFSNDEEFLRVEPLVKLDKDRGVSFPGTVNENSAKELTLRRCCSAESLAVQRNPDSEELSLSYLTIDSSIMAKDIRRNCLQDEIEKRFFQSQETNEADDTRLDPISSPYSPQASPDKLQNFQRSIGSINRSRDSRDEPETLGKPTRDHREMVEFEELVKIQTASRVGGGWKTLVSDDSRTILGKPLKSKTLHIFKCFTQLSVPSQELFSIILSRFNESWDNVLQPVNLSKEDDDAPVLQYKVPSEMGIFPRDFVVKRTHIENHPQKGWHLIHIKSVENSKATSDPSYVRGKVSSGGVIINSLNDSQSMLTIIIKADLGTLLPERVLYGFYTEKFNDWLEVLDRRCQQGR